MKSEEERYHIDHRKGSRSSPSIFDRGDTKSHAKCIDHKIDKLNKDIGATPWSQKAVTSYDEWVGEVFSHENGESTENLVNRRDALENKQEDEDAACGNRIDLGNIHDSDEGKDEE